LHGGFHPGCGYGRNDFVRSDRKAAGVHYQPSGNEVEVEALFIVYQRQEGAFKRGDLLLAIHLSDEEGYLWHEAYPLKQAATVRESGKQ
jgi:hypothetical protein